MIYKKYSFTESIYQGNKILFIARDSAGIVRFREPSEDKLKKTIDRVENAKKQIEELAAKEKAKAEKAAKKNRGLFQPTDEAVKDEATKVEEKSSETEAV